MNTDKITAESIAKDYDPKKASKLAALRKLDNRAKLPATIRSAFSKKTISMDKMLKTAFFSFLINFAYSAYHMIFGLATRSWWLLTVGVYYAVLSIVRFGVLRTNGPDRELFALRFTGIMLLVLLLPLGGTVILSLVKDRGTKYHVIAMITVAVYAFVKITLAATNWSKAYKSTSVRVITLRNISLADAFVSIFSLQRSMLATFEGMSEANIRLMNTSTGCAVCIIVFLLGANLLRSKDTCRSS